MKQDSELVNNYTWGYKCAAHYYTLLTLNIIPPIIFLQIKLFPLGTVIHIPSSAELSRDPWLQRKARINILQFGITRAIFTAISRDNIQEWLIYLNWNKAELCYIVIRNWIFFRYCICKWDCIIFFTFILSMNKYSEIAGPRHKFIILLRKIKKVRSSESY